MNVYIDAELCKFISLISFHFILHVLCIYAYEIVNFVTIEFLYLQIQVLAVYTNVHIDAESSPFQIILYFSLFCMF